MANEYTERVTLARAELKAAQRLIAADIRAYPTPISGCDAVFDGRLEGRTRARRALEALKAAVFIPTPRTPTPDAGVKSR